MFFLFQIESVMSSITIRMPDVANYRTLNSYLHSPWLKLKNCYFFLLEIVYGIGQPMRIDSWYVIECMPKTVFSTDVTYINHWQTNIRPGGINK